MNTVNNLIYYHDDEYQQALDIHAVEVAHFEEARRQIRNGEITWEAFAEAKRILRVADARLDEAYTKATQGA